MSLFLALFCNSLISTSWATCPADEVIQGNLTCSSTFYGNVDHTEISHLGGECNVDECYTCGSPYANEKQEAPEAVYTFHCQRTGNVVMEIQNLPCDLDIYVLDSTCDPNTGCVEGSTQPYNVNDAVEFECIAGDTYYVVVEAYGTRHLDVASGPCTDNGSSTGVVFSPSYTLTFDVSQSTGCAEDCNNGQDDDLDGFFDCDDDDCWTESFCCDLDGDGVFSEDCLGNDCDDSNPNIYSNAPEDGGSNTGNGDGLDNDCDGLIDEGTNNYDDDGDGFTEAQGDCDDANPFVNPDAEEILGNNLDDDCNGDVDSGTNDYDDDGDGYAENAGDCDDADPNVNPGMTEVPDNGLDDNCNGEIDEEEGTEGDVITKEDQVGACTCSSNQSKWDPLVIFFSVLTFVALRRQRSLS